MSPNAPANAPNMVAIVVVVILAWYLYQIVSRKQERIRYKISRTVVALVVYLVAAYILTQQGLPPAEAALISGLAGLGCAWLLVKPPKRERRIPKAVRRQVIARDLTSKGLKWDPAKYHIDHIVPFSRGGDNSARNLRVIEKHKNLRKGGKMPGFWDFLRQ
jgi:L-lactate permease